MDKILQRSLLYDFYGELLTDRQKFIYEDFVLNDLSLGEIAQEQEISRQGVFKIVQRCDAKLAEYEDKLHLVEKFVKAKEQISSIQNQVQNMKEHMNDMDYVKNCIDEIEATSKDLLEDF